MGRNWLTSLGNRKADQTLISSYAYGHDNVGNRTSMTEADGSVTSYAYDNVYRLTDETKRDSGNNVLYRYQYSYDYVGNRLTENNAGVINYTHSLFAQGRLYDNNNKLTQLVGPGGTTTFDYDGNGNTTSMTQPGPVTTTYGYNYENRLTSVTNPSYTAAYTYAADGLRLRVQESNNANPDRWMQYDGVRPVLEGTLSGDTFTTVNKYVWEGDSYYDPLMYSLIGGSWRYHMYDGLGSTRQLMLHTDQSITDTYQYEAFGNLLSSTGTTPNPYRYVGSLGYYQTGNSLMHLGARYYMPEVGRLLSADPAAQGITSYTYAANDPVLFADPDGEVNVRNCGRYASAVRAAVAAILRQLARGCLGSSALATCVQNRLRSRWFTIYCGGAYCAYNSPWLYGWNRKGRRYAIHLCWSAFEGIGGWLGVLSDPQPGVPYVVLHEALHACGQDERGAYRNAACCFPGKV